MPYSKGHISMMVHRIGKTLLIDEFDVHKHLIRQQQVTNCHIYYYFIFIGVMVFNATFNNISVICYIVAVILYICMLVRKDTKSPIHKMKDGIGHRCLMILSSVFEIF